MVGAVDENTAIRTLFNTGWGATTRISYENETFVPKTNETFVSLMFRPDDAAQHEIGSTQVTFRHPGLIFVRVYSPPDKGTSASLALADQVAEIFRRQRSVIADGRILYRAPTITPVGITDEGYFQVNVVIPYIRDSYH